MAFKPLKGRPDMQLARSGTGAWGGSGGLRHTSHLGLIACTPLGGVTVTM